MRCAKLALAFFALAISASGFAQNTPTRADAEQDPVLRAMLAELDRNRQQLQLPGFAKPFFLEYRIDDLAEYEARATNGALTGEHERHGRIARVTVRVGDYKLDSSTERGEGALQIAAVEDDSLALRYAFWAATDAAYKSALSAYTQKQAALKAVQTPPQADDFSHEKPLISLDPVAAIGLDRAAWKQLITEGSGLWRTDPAAKACAQEIETSNGVVQALVRTVYLVNSEGVILRKSAPEYFAEVGLEAQAPDGMRLDRSYSATATTAANLGAAERFHDGVLRALTGLHDLRNARVIAEEYHGPVLFTGNAAAHTFDEFFARPLVALRPQLGSTARTTGPFASSYHTRVLPEFLKIVDEPNLTEFQGKPLLGAYKVDDEGVSAQDVTLVDQGKLVSYLLGREPVRDFPASNGHARAAAAQPARPHISVLHVEASGALSQDDLLKKLIAMGKDQGLESVYLLERTAGVQQPRALYRIRVADGSRELVRGARLADLDLRAFRSGIIAAGQDPYVYNIFGGIPTTVIAPPLLFDDVTVKRSDEKNEKLPYYPPPPE
jgi:predicted Zn-dependent protease